MGFAGVYRAVYNYGAASEQELSLKENDLLYLLETADDGWWTVKKRVPGAASEEPEGIVPHNYIEPAKPEGGSARALYSYDRQTDEELSFSEGTTFDIYATDGDWVLVGKDGKEFGFVPFNYIEKISTTAPAEPTAGTNRSGGATTAVTPTTVEGTRTSHAAFPTNKSPSSTRPSSISPALSAHPDEDHPPRPQRPQRTGDIVTDVDAPPRPSRPSQRPARDMMDRDLPDEPRSKKEEPPKHTQWPITDISGRRRVAKTLVVAPTFITLINDDGGGRTQKWDVHDIKSYSSEKKHVFLDLENPTVSLELKASSQSEADHIVSSLGQIVGAGRGGGLEEVLAAAKSAGHKQGQIILDFKAANSKELSVAEYETVFIINDSDKDWWLVRNVSGKEGLVPRKFVHVDKKDGKISDFFRNKKQKDRHRDREMEREHESARHAARELHREKSTSSRADQKLGRSRSTRSTAGSGGDRTLPDARKMRLWVDRSGTFKVDAQLLGCSDGKVHLHKANGVKIAVPVPKLSFADVEYVESVTGVSLNEDKPLSASKSSRTSEARASADRVASSTDETNARNDTWLSFFLGCGVDPQNANRYAKNFTRDNMDESTLSEVNASVLRTLGLREGDILRVTKKINEKFGRVQNPDGGLYSNDGGALQNNQGTTPANVDNQVWGGHSKSPEAESGAPSTSQPDQPVQLSQQLTQPALQPQRTAAAAKPVQPQLTQAPTGALADLLGFGSAPATQPQTTGAANLQSTLIGGPTPALSASATGAPTATLQAQKTAEMHLAAQQRATQHQILRQQAELQKDQIRLLREQQEQLRRQQEELVQIQKTGSQLQALGPFATGVAQHSTFGPSAASVLAAPQPPQPRMFQAVQPQSTQPPVSQFNGFNAQQTGPFGGQQATGPFGQQPTGPFGQQATGAFVQQRTGPFAAAQATGPFQQPQQQQATGPFGQQQHQQQQQATGPFGQQPPNTVGAPQVTGPFQQPQPQQQRTGPLLGSQATGPFSTGFPTAQLAQSQQSGPFAAGNTSTTSFPQVRSTPTGPFSNAPTGGGFPGAQAPTTSFGTTFSASQPNLTNQFANLQLGNQITGPFQQPQPTNYNSGIAPFQNQATGPFQQSQQSRSLPTQATTTFGNQFQQTGPQSQFPTTSFTQLPNTGAQSQFNQQPAGASFPQTAAGMPFQSYTTGPFQQSLPTSSFPTGAGASFPAQATGPFQQPVSHTPQASAPTSFPQTSFGQVAANPAASQVPLQNQATGFGFGNQPQQQQPQARANFGAASASNPFGL